MDQSTTENVTKTKKKASKFSAVRVTFNTQKKLSQILNKVNKKPFGRRVRTDEVLSLLLDRFTESDSKMLQENSLSNTDKLELKYKEHIKKHGPMKREDFIGLVLERLKS